MAASRWARRVRAPVEEQAGANGSISGTSKFPRRIIDWLEVNYRVIDPLTEVEFVLGTNDNNGLVRPTDFSDCIIPLRQLAPPPPGEIHIWYLDLGRLGRSLQLALDGRQELAKPPRLTLGQLRFARRFYLRLLLGSYLGIPGKSVNINRSDRGKPVLDKTLHAEELHFSMAKSEDRLLIGFSSSGLVGVDLEPANRRAHRALGVAQRYFSQVEFRALASLNPERIDEAFLRTWACKEAVVKASGEGIANQLCRFTVETDPGRPPAILHFENDDAEKWSLKLVQPEENYIGAVAVHDGLNAVRAFSLLAAAGSD
jgi:4'-phosphopantetheinyl transferase